ncbi:MAG: serine/threonine protein kinase [Candidatus Riflebacteria bacterium]|nr:serine/threonine protein kinase [Candidatus Riflebacteria bacterium]
MDGFPEALGRYRIVGKVGAGGMGVVLRAHDPVLKRDVAVKLVPAHLRANPAVAARFHREVLTLARVSHPNVVHVFDGGDEQGCLYYVMELLAGSSLDHRVKQPAAAGPPPPFDAKEFLDVFAPVVDALAVVHEHGIIHRDIKPANILGDVPERGAVLTDFGLTWIESDEKLTREGAVVGTARYIAPEQVRGRPPDALSDLYSMGLTMWEFATREVPFKESKGPDILMRRVTEEMPSVATLAPEVPETLAIVIDTCLRREPERRFGSVRELHSVLARARQKSQGRGLAVRSSVSSGLRAVATPSGSQLVAARQAPAPSAAPSRSRSRAVLAGGGFAALGLLALVTALAFREPAATGPPGPRATAAAASPAGASGATTAGGLAAHPQAQPKPGPLPRPRPPLDPVLLGQDSGPAGHVALSATGQALLACWTGHHGRLRLAASEDLGRTWKRPAADGKLAMDPRSSVAILGRGERHYLLYLGPGPESRPFAFATACGADASRWQTSTVLGPALDLGCQLELVAGPAGCGVDAMLAVWEAPGDSSPLAAWGKPSRGTWSSGQAIARGRANGGITAAISVRGEALITWQQWRLAPNISELMASRAAGPDAPWSTPALLTLRTSGEHRKFPVAAADEQGVYLQWQQTTTLGSRLVAGRLQDSGLIVDGIGTVEPFSKDPGTALAACGGRLWSVYRPKAIEQICWSASTVGERTWGPAHRFDSVEKISPQPALVATPPGWAWVLWVNTAGQVRVMRLP